MHKPVTNPAGLLIVLLGVILIFAVATSASNPSSATDTATPTPQVAAPATEPMVTEASYEKLRAEHNALVDKYNALLTVAQTNPAASSYRPIHCTTNNWSSSTTTDCY